MITVVSGTGSRWSRASGAPASTSRLALLRRSRAARWSNRNRLSRRSGSSSLRSSRSISVSCWSTSERLRRDMVSNMSLTSRRNRASSPASSRARVCSSSTAWATWPISSVVYTGNGCGMGSAPPALTRATSSSRSWWATLSAPSRRTRSGRTSARATSNTTSSAITMAASTSAVSVIAALRRSVASACTDLVTDAVASVTTCSAIPSVVWIERSSSGLSTSTLAGSDMIAIRVTICCCNVLASGDPAPSTSLMPNSVDGSVPASAIIEVRSCGSGRSDPRVTRISCIVICPRAPTARLRPCASARIRSLPTRTDALITSSAVSRSGA
ncbi:hypothetical protein AWC11_22215 [Mycobacterium interjectum]|nr:hypothetical protein AWC11_22215 [Mycobacterium interjectum]